jgi:DNA-binding HxlR family transcriptional regulator
LVLIAGSEEGIATNILASRLKHLVAAGLLTRDDARRGQRAAYSLTAAGIQVLPVMVTLGNWGPPTATASAAYGSAPNCSASVPRSWAGASSAR